MDREETKDEEAKRSSEIFRALFVLSDSSFALATNRVLPLTSILLLVAIWLRARSREFSR
jgi:hypothetical protein